MKRGYEEFETGCYRSFECDINLLQKKLHCIPCQLDFDLCTIHCEKENAFDLNVQVDYHNLYDPE